ncbi:uncharacterized protein PV09_07516 [Verruconis gallopava]|uniref:Uncharacterized protein n=1 Tax=Verruconis gallopava TaxID=253628 RepID=A0A0D2A2Q0_9PEZI|nr:uncharacterized protein PV09_07516 [Verruconis gallopava]KIW00998.1 hypothetical protein PV09_07516 [Verruconis gallopava]
MRAHLLLSLSTAALTRAAPGGGWDDTSHVHTSVEVYSSCSTASSPEQSGKTSWPSFAKPSSHVRPSAAWSDQSKPSEKASKTWAISTSCKTTPQPLPVTTEKSTEHPEWTKASSYMWPSAGWSYQSKPSEKASKTWAISTSCKTTPQPLPVTTAKSTEHPEWTKASSYIWPSAGWSDQSKPFEKASKTWAISTSCKTTAHPSAVTTAKSSEHPAWTSTPCTTSSTLTCPHVCHLDFFGTLLAYPTVIEYSSVYAQTINAYVTDFSDGSPPRSSEETVTAPPAPPAAPLTWTAFGVVLTYPTTYVAYTSINYATVVPLSAEGTCTTTTSAPLIYPTVWPSLIAPSSLIQQPGSLPPATVVQWLDSLPTVEAQLGGNVCDPANGGVAPFVPTATVTSATTIDGNTRIVHTTTVQVSSSSSSSTSSSTPSPTPTPAPQTSNTPQLSPTTPTTASPTPTSSTPTAVVQTINAAAIPRKFGTETWLGNALAAVLLAL